MEQEAREHGAVVGVEDQEQARSTADEVAARELSPGRDRRKVTEVALAALDEAQALGQRGAWPVTRERERIPHVVRVLPEPQLVLRVDVLAHAAHGPDRAVAAEGITTLVEKIGRHRRGRYRYCPGDGYATGVARHWLERGARFFLVLDAGERAALAGWLSTAKFRSSCRRAAGSLSPAAGALDGLFAAASQRGRGIAPAASRSSPESSRPTATPSSSSPPRRGTRPRAELSSRPGSNRLRTCSRGGAWASPACASSRRTPSGASSRRSGGGRGTCATDEVLVLKTLTTQRRPPLRTHGRTPACPAIAVLTAVPWGIRGSCCHTAAGTACTRHPAEAMARSV